MYNIDLWGVPPPQNVGILAKFPEKLSEKIEQLNRKSRPNVAWLISLGQREISHFGQQLYQTKVEQAFLPTRELRVKENNTFNILDLLGKCFKLNLYNNLWNILLFPEKSEFPL